MEGAMVKREVLPEILDELSDDDARAMRSRRDLRLVNALMGNERWIESVVRQESSSDWKLAELGAGRGELLARLARDGRECRGYDLVPRPAGLGESIAWEQGDFLETLDRNAAEVVVGSLILHHFEEGALRGLGSILKSRRLLVFAEPLRSRLALAEGYTLFPLVNDVTRHDMITSIWAGFRRGELAEKLALGPNWQWREEVTLRGGVRSLARRVDSEVKNG